MVKDGFMMSLLTFLYDNSNGDLLQIGFIPSLF